jgi:hypothetical protein
MVYLLFKIIKFHSRQGAHKYRTLEEIAYHIESLDVFAVLRKQFEELDKTICKNYIINCIFIE